MKSAVSSERWREAQRAEREYWKWPTVDPRELSRIAVGLSEAAVWVNERFPSGPPAGDWIEVGIGPLGIGCAHFLINRKEPRRLVGVDPLPLISREEYSPPLPLAAMIEACGEDYEHVVAPGENTGLEAAGFGFAILHNMMDHVRDPGAVLREVHRLLRPEGIMFLRCDTFSWLGQLHFVAVTRVRRSDSWLVRAHPHRFRFAELLALVSQAGFSVLDRDPPRAAVLRDVAGRSYRSSILAKKPGADSPALSAA
jgi:SAM-dependent methyltransferase